MELHRLAVDAAMRPDAVDSGWSQVTSRGPRTVTEVLAAASSAMDEEDRQAAMAADPVAWLRGGAEQAHTLGPHVRAPVNPPRRA